MFEVQEIQFASFTLYGFGIYFALGFLALLTYLLYSTKNKAGIYISIVLPLSIFTGRLLYCFFRRNTIFYSPMDGSFLGLQTFFNLTDGGIIIYGCLLGALIAVFLIAKKEKASFLDTLGLFSPGLAILMAFMHYANFLGGEGFGNLAEENANPILHVYNAYGEACIAVFRFEALFCLLFAGYLFFSRKKLSVKALNFLSLYAAMFLFFSSLHRDNSLRLEINGFIIVDQLISYVILLILLVYFLYKSKKNKTILLTSFILCVAFVVAAEFFEKIPVPTLLLYSLSLASCINLATVFTKKANGI
ncbi:MAG: prolipoprotein diacylglyceryl transferase [Eubacteriales bacterium]|nr:prolipoprotein diacylglyceryl transferase [Eubacteriales bacterium]